MVIIDAELSMIHKKIEQLRAQKKLEQRNLEAGAPKEWWEDEEVVYRSITEWTL